VHYAPSVSVIKKKEKNMGNRSIMNQIEQRPEHQGFAKVNSTFGILGSVEQLPQCTAKDEDHLLSHFIRTGMRDIPGQMGALPTLHELVHHTDQGVRYYAERMIAAGETYESMLAKEQEHTKRCFACQEREKRIH
jgi:hypothetical protein